jgi:uncharacterized protein YndB with AHSA1/START domain
MGKPLKLVATFATDPLDVYDAWISGERHAAMTGAPATSEPHAGGEFTAWDGYITGWHLELEPAVRILQTWRTSEFPEGAADSRVEVLFAEAPEGTRVTLVHRDIPDGQASRYEAGWKDYYFTPMQEYFAVSAEPKGAPPASAAKPAKSSKKKTTKASSKKKTTKASSKKKTTKASSKKKTTKASSKKKTAPGSRPGRRAG